MDRMPIFLSIVMFLFAACNDKKQQGEAPKELQSQQQGELPAGHPSITSMGGVSSVAGVSWTVPSKWNAGPEKPMRVATYNIPAAEGDAEGGELGVFYFGSGQGGNVQMNIDRWFSQFENGKPDQSSKEVNGMKVDLVKVAGTYLAPSGPMMQSSGKKSNYRLLGAIVAAPEGSVFFKLTGPAKTIVSAEADFNSLVGSLTK
jgi:hypothetical protein